MMRNIGYRRFLWALSLLGVLIFIFGNSLMPASASGAESRSFFDRLAEIFPFLTHHLVRKLAHFAEYALLGAHLAFIPSLFLPHSRFGYPIALSAGVLVAAVDEGIQCFVPGRAGLWGDVLLDGVGSAFGVFFMLGVWLIYLKRKERRLGKQK